MTEAETWARIKRRQANRAEAVAGVAAGIGDHVTANACYSLAAKLRRQAEELESTTEERHPEWEACKSEKHS